ncbi:MAG: hypothetical protein ACREDR_14280, partial [Blastocatellia bacterium]
MKFFRLVLLISALVAVALGVTAWADSHSSDLTSTSSNGEVRQWQLTGPWGGDVRSLAVATDDPDTLYLGTSDGQVFRS